MWNQRKVLFWWINKETVSAYMGFFTGVLKL